jgi:hypothetical protein
MASAAQPIPQVSPRLFSIEVFPETHPHYTCGDLVRGVVRVRPTLRPQRISIIFRGYCVIFDKDDRGAAPVFFGYKQDLFESSGAHENFDILRRGTASDGNVELPFEFMFPPTVEMPPPADKAWRYSKDSPDHPRFQYSPGFVPPPSCTVLVPARGPLAPKIYYTLEACLKSNNADSPKVNVRHHLKFLPPAPEYDLALLQPNIHLGTSLPKHTSRYKLIRTRKLLPGYAESSKLGRVKDMLVEKEFFFGLDSFSEVPFAKFNLVATPARILVIGSPLPVTITVKHLERSASLPNPPDLFMRRIRIQLLPAYSILIPRPASTAHATKEVVETARDIWTLLDKKYDEGNGEPLFDNLQLSDFAETMLAHEKLVPSFTSYGLTLEYEIQVEIWGECASHEFSGIACRSEIQIVSGWNAPHALNNTFEGNTSVPEPEYQELDPMADLHRAYSHDMRHGPSAMAPTYDYEAPPPMRMEAPLRSMPPPYMG